MCISRLYFRVLMWTSQNNFHKEGGASACPENRCSKGRTVWLSEGPRGQQGPVPGCQQQETEEGAPGFSWAGRPTHKDPPQGGGKGQACCPHLWKCQKPLLSFNGTRCPQVSLPHTQGPALSVLDTCSAATTYYKSVIATRKPQISAIFHVEPGPV